MRVMRTWKADCTRRVQRHSAKRRFAPFLERVESRELLSSLWSQSVTPAVSFVRRLAGGRVGGEVLLRRRRLHHRPPVLQGPVQHRHPLGHLWDASGNLLATATFTGETASGWQEVDFTNPVAITANTTYVASYFAPAGGYAATTTT